MSRLTHAKSHYHKSDNQKGRDEMATTNKTSPHRPAPNEDRCAVCGATGLQIVRGLAPTCEPKREGKS